MDFRTACLVVATVLAPMPALAEDCVAVAEAPWPSAGPDYRVTAMATGPTCDKAVALLTVRSGDGTLVHHGSFDAGQVMLLAGIAAEAELTDALKAWIAQDNPSFDTTGDLPAWPEGAEGPAAGEFPFYPAVGVDRIFYEEMRAADLPMACFVQGMESSHCVGLSDGMAVDLGVQTFPG